jgi:NAD(P)-dependent dehydrogenase (short-subunit alcohol dehydrogenase family)
MVSAGRGESSVPGGFSAWYLHVCFFLLSRTATVVSCLKTCANLEAEMLDPESVFLITGAAQGVGRAAVELVVGRGHRCLACDVQAQPVEELCDRLAERAQPFTLDIRDGDGWDDAFSSAGEAFGKVDVLVNNAAVLHSGLAGDVAWEHIEETIEVNLLGTIRGIRAAVPRFIEQGGGHIVTVGSFLSYISVPGLATYAATKHAVRAFVDCLAVELRDGPISFSLVLPAAIDTPMLAKMIDDDSVPVVFSDPVLSAATVAEAIYRAAEGRPAEMMVPWFRGTTLKLASLSRGILRLMLPGAEKRGRERQAALRAERTID